MLERERQKLLAVRLCGPRVVARLEAIGITALADLAERDPEELVLAVNVAAGRPIWRRPMAQRAMANLIAAACLDQDRAARRSLKRKTRSKSGLRASG
jgi:hypothetical protein